MRAWQSASSIEWRSVARMFRLQFHVRPAWPPLAWLARLNSASDLIEIEHGSGVEASSLGFCEAVWDGDFSQFGFDQTDVVFGSGGRVREGQFVFVSSATTVDRLHWYRSGGAAFVSNSLACLISGIDGTVDPRHEGYFAFFESIILGMHKYQSELATSAGPVHLTYFRNLVWDGQQMLEQDKPVPKRQLDCFDDYYSILKTDFECLKPNLEDPRRTFKLSPLATVSTGYDSPVGAVMGRYAGLRETISMSRGRGEVEDDGSLIAKSLGLEPIVVQSTHSPGDAEQWIPTFVASDSKGEDLYFANAHQELRGRFLITGYSGSRVWDTSDADYADFRRGDQSGLSHTEARLHIGYIHCPVHSSSERKNTRFDVSVVRPRCPTGVSVATTIDQCVGGSWKLLACLVPRSAKPRKLHLFCYLIVAVSCQNNCSKVLVSGARNIH